MLALINIRVWEGGVLLAPINSTCIIGAHIITVLICEWERETEILDSLI